MTGLGARAAELRSAFDHSFAVPARLEPALQHDLLAIRVGIEPYAIRLAELTGLFADRTVTQVPGGSSALLGIAGFRGALVPVYSLGILLGHSGAPALRWLVIAAAAPVAFAFDVFEAHMRASADALLPRQATAGTPGFAPEFIRTESAVRPVLHLPSVIDALGTTQVSNAELIQE